MPLNISDYYIRVNCIYLFSEIKMSKEQYLLTIKVVYSKYDDILFSIGIQGFIKCDSETFQQLSVYCCL